MSAEMGEHINKFKNFVLKEQTEDHLKRKL